MAGHLCSIPLKCTTCRSAAYISHRIISAHLGPPPVVGHFSATLPYNLTYSLPFAGLTTSERTSQHRELSRVFAPRRWWGGGECPIQSTRPPVPIFSPHVPHPAAQLAAPAPTFQKERKERKVTPPGSNQPKNLILVALKSSPITRGSAGPIFRQKPRAPNFSLLSVRRRISIRVN